MKNTYIAILIVLIFTACSGEYDENTTTSVEVRTELLMEVGVSYLMKEGQTLVKNSDLPQIVLEIDNESRETRAKLLSGSASIVGLSIVRG